MRLCERCQAGVPAPRVFCRCGGRVVEYYSKDEATKVEAKPPDIGWQDVGKFVGARMTGGNPIGVLVGAIVGRMLENDVLTVTPVIEPEVVNVVGLDRRALAPVKERIKRVASNAITIGGVRRKREKKAKKVVR